MLQIHHVNARIDMLIVSVRSTWKCCFSFEMFLVSWQRKGPVCGLQLSEEKSLWNLFFFSLLWWSYLSQCAWAFLLLLWNLNFVLVCEGLLQISLFYLVCCCWWGRRCRNFFRKSLFFVFLLLIRFFCEIYCGS